MMGFGKTLCCLAWCAAAAAGVAARAAGGEAPAAAPDRPQRITVTASRIPAPVETVAEPVTVFTASRPGGAADAEEGNRYSAGDIEARQYRSLLDVMRHTPGVSFVENGGEGSVTGLFLRGMGSGETRVLIDGMPVNDPSSIEGNFDFGFGHLDNIAQIEVLRGAQSTLHGSSAAAGVVAMQSRRGEGKATGFASAEAGSRGTLRTRVGSSAGSEKADYSFAGTLYHTDGISRADRRNGNTEKDAYEYGSFNLRLGVNPSSCLRFDLFANGFKGETEFDGSFPVMDDRLKTRLDRYMLRPQATLTLFDGAWEQKAGYGVLRTTRRNIDDNTPGMDWNRTKFTGELRRFDYQSVLRLHETNTLLAGMDVEEESMETVEPWYGAAAPARFSPPAVTTTGVYLEDRLALRDVFFATAGLRYTDHETFGGRATWKTSALFVLPTGTRLKASAGTGFKAPTLYQLYDAWSGNAGLKAEKTLGWDAGFEQAFFDGDRLAFGASFFRNAVRDGVDYDLSANRYRNIGDYRTWGVESFLALRLTDSVRFSLQHTWLRTERSATGEELLRRPKHAASAAVDISLRDRGTLTFGVQHVGSRLDSTRRMPSYVTARVAASWKLNDHFEVFGRVENLLNRKYQQIDGYGTEGVGFFGGLTASF